VQNCRGSGVYCDQVTLIRLLGSTFSGNKGAGVYLVDSAQGLISASDFTNNGDDLTIAASEGQLIIENCDDIAVMGNNVEDFVASTVKNGVVLNGSKGCVVGGNEFSLPSAVAASRGIQLYNSARGNTILSNMFSLVDTAVNLDSAANEIGNIVMSQMAKTTGTNAKCQVVFPADVKSFVFVNDQTEGTGIANNKSVGLAFPGLAGVGTGEVGSTVLRGGLLVFDTTANKFKFYNGAAWETITSA